MSPGVTLAQTADAWDFARPLIVASLGTAPPDETIADVEGKLASGHYVLWTSDNSAAVTSVATQSQRKVLTVVHGGGELAELVDQIEPALGEYARATGCSEILGGSPSWRVGWARCRHWIEAEAEANGFYTIEWIEQQIEAGNLTFWPARNGAALTEFLTYPNGKALNIFAACGEPNASLKDLLGEVEPRLVTFAQAAGCRWILGFGRPGFQRACKSMGYALKYTVIAKDISDAK